MNDYRLAPCRVKPKIYFISRQEKRYDSFIDATIEDLVGFVKGLKFVGFDTETSGLDPHTSRILLMQFSDKETAYVLDCTTYTKEEIIPVLDLLKDRYYVKVGTNLKFDYKQLLGTFEVEASGTYDTQVIDEIVYNGIYNNLHPNSSTAYMMYLKSFSLRTQVARHLKEELPEDKDVRRSFIDMPYDAYFTEKQIRYAAYDPIECIRVREIQLPMLQKYELIDLAKLECNLIPVLATMEYRGIGVDKVEWEKVIAKYTSLMEQEKKGLDKFLHEKVKEVPVLNKYIRTGFVNLFGDTVPKINGRKVTKKDTTSVWNSSQDVLNILRTLGIGNEEFSSRKPYQTKVSKPSKSRLRVERRLANIGLNIDDFKVRTNKIEGNLPDTNINSLLMLVKEEETKEGTNYIPLKPEYKIVADLLKFREYEKAINTYGYNLLNKVSSVTDRIHPNFKQLYPETGRLSCENPNLQNIKAENDFRRLFVPRAGYDLITADYSGQELVIIAEGSGDPVFVEAFLKGEDLHSRVASILYGVEVTKENENKHLRAPAKNLNFGLAYGMGADKLAKKLGISIEEAKALMDTYFAKFPLIKKYLNESAAFARQFGCITTFPPFKRVRWFDNHDDALRDAAIGDRTLISRIERQGKNTPIQGTGADMVKLALVNIHKALKEQMFDCNIVLQVHDEIVVEASKLCSAEVKEVVEKTMEETAKVFIKRVPMRVEANISNYWKK